MSSGNLMHSTTPELYLWNEKLSKSNYIYATYDVLAHCYPDDAARGMAMEQSASTSFIPGYVSPDSLEEWTIRVHSVVDQHVIKNQEVPVYGLTTDVYPEATHANPARIVLAIPKRLLGSSPNQWFNVLVGELPRLGFLSTFKLTSIEGLEDLGTGPSFGVSGIRQHLGITDGPILCRAMHPAVGPDTVTMMRLNHDVLASGFHCVKDDELMHFESTADFERHVRSMIDCRDRASDKSGEKKSYLATLICDPAELENRWQLCVKYGVDGVLISPLIQGLGTLAMLARRGQIPILGHNTGVDLMTRHPNWGITDAAWNTILRVCGADWMVTPGPFGNTYPPASNEISALNAITTPHPRIRQCMPILQGGKRPEGLSVYSACVKSKNYMLTVASWVDGHPTGLMGGAKIFREAVDATR